MVYDVLLYLCFSGYTLHGADISSVFGGILFKHLLHQIPRHWKIIN